MRSRRRRGPVWRPGMWFLSTRRTRATSRSARRRHLRTWPTPRRSSSSTIVDTRLPSTSDLWYERTSVATATPWSRFSSAGPHDQTHLGRRLSRYVRSDHERPPRYPRARPAAVRSRDRHARDQPAQGTAVHRRRADPVHPRCDAASRRAAAVRAVRRPDRRLLREARCAHAGPRFARPRGLRVRVPVRAHEPPSRADRRYGVLHDGRAQPLRLELARQGSREPRRRRARPRAGTGRRSPRVEVRQRQEGQAAMKLKIASRLDPIKPSIPLAVPAKAARLKAEGVDVISFGAGEPDFDTPEHIKQAVREGLEKGVGKYTDVAGIAILRNNPSNPTGAVYTRAQIEALAKVVLDKDILVISDDIYRSLVYAGAEYVSIAAVSPELADHTVLVDGVSKTYAMTGWRIGYTATTAALSPLIKAMSKIQGQSTSNATHAAQVATFAALTGTQDPVETMRKAFDERRIEMVKLLRAIPNAKCREPKGAFYAFPDVSAYVGKTSPEGKVLASDVELCDWLVDVGRVAVVPGSGFGAAGHVRLSYATSMPNITEGVGRLGRALGTLT